MAGKICFISASQELTTLYNETLHFLPEPPAIFEGAMQDSVTAAMMALKQGYDILVTLEHNARRLWGKIDAPILSIPHSYGLDIALAIHRARKEYGEPIAFFESHEPYDILFADLREMLDCNFNVIVFKDKLDCIEKLKQAIQEGIRAVVGGAMIAPLAREMGIPCISLLPSREDILKTYNQAKHMATIRQLEEREAMKFKYVVQYSFSGIIVVNEKNEVVVFNPTAENIFEMKANDVLGQPLDKVFPKNYFPNIDKHDRILLDELITINAKQLMVNIIPTIEGDQVVAAIFTFHEVSNIQSMEEKIRRAGHTKGLSARLSFQDIIGNSKATRQTIFRAQRFTSTDETVLITGESGTGKEVFAQSIHNASPRRAHPFLAVNCSAISKTLLESELFGYVEGAFTGARRGGKQGMFELAHGGTIFLDEIGELPHEAQGHLLRVLQEKEVMRVGDAKVTPINVRVIAATNRPLESAVQQNIFRADLYHRLNILQLRLPPLREIPEDILPLAYSFITKWCSSHSLANQIKGALSRYEYLLIQYSWPGNVRELQNLLRKILALVTKEKGEELAVEIKELLDESLGNPLAVSISDKDLKQNNSCERLKDITTEIIRQQYKDWHGSKSAFAKKMGIGRTTLWKKLKA
jgi:transcriptional regulator with PAS, ATPase and Fis domain